MVPRDIAISEQTRFWNEWNAQYREPSNTPINRLSRREADFIFEQFQKFDLRPANILEVGCGSGWFSAELAQLGKVTAVDLASDVVARAQARYPQIDFRAGDFMSLELPAASFDLVVTLETLSHVADQGAFSARIAHLLKAGGHLGLVTQNRAMYERMHVPPPGPGQLRQWVDRRRLQELLLPYFRIRTITTLEPPEITDGVMRFVNSYKLNALLAALTSKARVQKLKERAGFGLQIGVLAQKR